MNGSHSRRFKANHNNQGRAHYRLLVINRLAVPQYPHLIGQIFNYEQGFDRGTSEHQSAVGNSCVTWRQQNSRKKRNIRDMPITASIVALLLVAISTSLFAQTKGLSDNDIKQNLIDQCSRIREISCALDNRANNSIRRGKLSAYSKPGGTNVSAL
jgi:hypothetical protein